MLIDSPILNHAINSFFQFADGAEVQAQMYIQGDSWDVIIVVCHGSWGDSDVSWLFHLKAVWRQTPPGLIKSELKIFTFICVKTVVQW